MGDARIASVDEVASAGEPRVMFAPIQVVSDPAAHVARAIEVVLVSGERLTIPDGVSRDQVRVMLAALRAAC